MPAVERREVTLKSYLHDDDSIAATLDDHGRDEPASFHIYQADCVSVTSTLFAGGDWHWRLTSCGGVVLVDCGGYLSHTDALVAIDCLRKVAGSATLSSRLLESSLDHRPI